jgi:DNA-binding NarL/FixJ family response regulator
VTRTLPIGYRGEEVGRLVLARERPFGARSSVSARDEQLLADVVRQAAVAIHTGFLAKELQRSREQIVAAREEERHAARLCARHRRRRHRAGPTEALPQLTAREREILDLVAAGRTNAQIAGLLYLSPKTVRNNVSNIFAKIQLADRAEAIIRAREAGLG